MKSLLKSSYAVREPIREEVVEALVQNTNTKDETLKISFIRNKLLGGLLIVAEINQWIIKVKSIQDVCLEMCLKKQSKTLNKVLLNQLQR